MRKIILVTSFFTCLIFISGCALEQSENMTQADIELETPQFSTEEAESVSTERDFGDKRVESGFWINEIQDRSGTWYRYIPMMSQKIPGVYDLEDSEENKSIDSFGAYNRPGGTQYLTKQSSSFMTEFWSNPLLGYNDDENNEDIELNPEVDMNECLPFNDICNSEYADVGCVTFALYNDVYDDFPQINVQVYGISEELWISFMGEQKDWNLASYDSLIDTCKEQNYSNCSMLSEKNVSSSGIYYIDYAQLSKMGNYKQYIIVYRFSKCTSCAYCIHGNQTYNIIDDQTYQEWKKEHLNQYISGE